MICYFHLRILLCFMSIPCADLKTFFGIFGNCGRQLIFFFLFRVNDGKCQSILPTQVFANSPRCCVNTKQRAIVKECILEQRGLMIMFILYPLFSK